MGWGYFRWAVTMAVAAVLAIQGKGPLIAWVRRVHAAVRVTLRRWSRGHSQVSETFRQAHTVRPEYLDEPQADAAMRGTIVGDLTFHAGNVTGADVMRRIAHDEVLRSRQQRPGGRGA